MGLAGDCYIALIYDMPSKVNGEDLFKQRVGEPLRRIQIHSRFVSKRIALLR